MLSEKLYASLINSSIIPPYTHKASNTTLSLRRVKLLGSSLRILILIVVRKIRPPEAEKVLSAGWGKVNEGSTVKGWKKHTKKMWKRSTESTIEQRKRGMEEIPQMSNWLNYKIKDRWETAHADDPLEWSMDTIIENKKLCRDDDQKCLHETLKPLKVNEIEFSSQSRKNSAWKDEYLF